MRPRRDIASGTPAHRVLSCEPSGAPPVRAASCFGRNPAARQSKRGFPFPLSCSPPPSCRRLPTRPLLAALAYADDTKNYREYRAKRQNSLRVHGWHPLSGLPGCDEAPRSSYHARRPLAHNGQDVSRSHSVGSMPHVSRAHLYVCKPIFPYYGKGAENF